MKSLSINVPGTYFLIADYKRVSNSVLVVVVPRYLARHTGYGRGLDLFLQTSGELLLIRIHYTVDAIIRSNILNLTI